MCALLPEAAVKPEIDLRHLPPKRLATMAEAGDTVLAIQRGLAERGDNVVSELLKGQGRFYAWDHYPKGDVFDARTRSQFYYHAHPGDQRLPGDEHGHFHTFRRCRSLSAPAGPPDFRHRSRSDNAPTHLMAVAMDTDGLPFRLLTVNRWVTGEVWHAADEVVALLDRFDVGETGPSWRVNRWLTNMLCLFRPQIVNLIHKRDEIVAAWQREHPACQALEDRRLEVTSYVDVRIADQIDAVARARDTAG